jgi:hypothetical protein
MPLQAVVWSPLEIKTRRGWAESSAPFFRWRFVISGWLL